MRNKVRIKKQKKHSRNVLNNTFHDVDVSTLSVSVIGLSAKSILHVIVLQSSLMLHPSPRVLEPPQEPLNSIDVPSSSLYSRSP